ncbi:2-succinyl-5-enolpyruvyl-6-hydroxy-3-cyclohexene-1-carboxylic-acid synthase [Polaribacter uvawellassae]|uniref:2-succinyl-5-enolpyruvyl-6-hydroxy-3- cyclohexene-1-carboxylic-acid synthase n=1 Tax=Polaribacter uvawellassae TaxID=3133495 RepID=UPI00321BBAEB
MYPKKPLAQLVISACHQFHIDTVVISPGSRNAPLTVGFSNHPEIKTMSVVDERCAAFFALGIAQQTQKTVAIVCTSGSALLNYYPAIAEAFYSNIPLVVISADRPKHMIDIGDGQTIRQENVFQNHILFSANLVDDITNKNVGLSGVENSLIISEALQIAITKKGPIHINVPFDEPLYETVEELDEFTFPIVIARETKQSLDINEFSEIWNASTKKMILVGTLFPDEELQGVIQQFKNDNSVIILTETTSNIASENTINSIDKLIFPLSEEEFSELKPDVLLTFGGMIVSKKIKQFLRKHQPTHHWHIDEQKAMNTFHCLSEYVQEKPFTFLSKLISKSNKIESNYQQKWLREKEKRAEKHQQYLSKILHSDLKVFEQVLESVPENSQLQLGNSSVVRYAQLFDVKDSIKIFCNRGTSGIDGSTSTAIGAAFASENQTVFITGDLSFFYDSNALWNNYIPKNFRIILINNNGGGIFRFIPGPKSTNALEYFETPHQLTAEHLCKMHQLEYISALETTKVSSALQEFYQESNAPKVLEIFTDKIINETVLKEYFNHLK